MLSLLLWLPVIGAALVGFYPGNLEYSRLRQITITVTAIIFIISLYLLAQFNLNSSAMQFVEYHNWLPQIGLSYSLGVDGLSLPLVILNTFLTGIAVYSIGDKIERPRLYYSLILLINAGISGALMAQNLLFFIIFYELELIPFYLAIAIWGGDDQKGSAAIKFLLYTAVSGLLVLAAFLGMAFLTDANTFDYSKLNLNNLDFNVQLTLLIILLIGFGIKIPLVPLHSWLPDAYVEASPAVTILLGGIFAKLGTYGLVRFGLQMFPETWSTVAPTLAIIGTVSVIYGALTAIAQKDIKRMVAYSSIGHMGYILVAAAAGTQLSILGAVSQMIAHGLILALLFHLVGVIERKVGTRDIDILNGLMNPIRGLPLISALLILAGMASAGIPGLVGFIAEFIVFQGSFSRFPIPTLLCIIASGLTAVYFVILLNRTCFGKLDNKLAYYPKVLWTESIPALVLTVTILVLGIQPNWLTKWIEPTTNNIAMNVPAEVGQQVAFKTIN
jgi:NAD(P)H-quinone oxidoreductase subunit 4